MSLPGTTTLLVNATREDLLSANDRLHWAVRANRTRYLRGLGWYAVSDQAAGAHHERCVLTVTIAYPPLARRRDAANLAPTVKALIDGAVDAGLLPDDNDRVILATTYRASTERGSKGVWGFDLIFDEAPQHGTSTVVVP